MNIDNVFQFALGGYDNPQCKTAYEFDMDVKRFKQIARLCTSYEKNKKTTNLHCLLNTILTCYNVFKKDHCTSLLYYHVKKDCHWVLNYFLVFLNMVDVPLQEDKELTYFFESFKNGY